MECKMPIHNWTLETMNECAEVHMEQICWVYCNYANAQEKKERIYQLIDHYFKIKCDVYKRGNDA